MSTFRLIRFECGKQLKSLTFLFILALFAVFACSQLSEIFHLPVTNENDIQALSKISSDTSQYVYVTNTDDSEVKALSLAFLQEQLNENSLSQDVKEEMLTVIQMLQDDSFTFNDIVSATADYKYIPAWLNSCEAQYGQSLTSVEEANQNILSSLGNKGYTPILFKNYVTYMQIILTLLIFPIFLLLLTRDYRHGMYEIIYTQPVSSNKYLLCRYMGALIPTAVYLYLLGVLLNLVSAFRFIEAGFEYQYTPFAPYFFTYIFPALFFFSAFIMVLMLLIKKAVAVLPIYTIYVLFNVTPKVFVLGSEDVDWIYIINPVLRLDRELTESMPMILLNRTIYLLLGTVMLIIACWIYGRLRKNMRRVVTI